MYILTYIKASMPPDTNVPINIHTTSIPPDTNVHINTYNCPHHQIPIYILTYIQLSIPPDTNVHINIHTSVHTTKYQCTY